MEINKFFEDAQDAIEHIDEDLAGELLKKIKEFSKKNSDLVLTKKLNDIETNLKIVNFPNISNEDSEKVLREKVLRFFQLEISLEERINTRFLFQGRFLKNELRVGMKRSILENNELIGDLAIGQWLKKFDQTYNVENRTENDILNFLMNDSQARRLDGKSREILKKILHAYEMLLASELVDIFEVVMIDKAMQKGRGRGGMATENQFDRIQNDRLQRVSYQKTSQSENSAPMAKVQMTLQEALKKFDKLGEQHLSANPIKLKIFETPVRPSIKNWISDYYEKIDARKHDSIERGNYLFHSENARRLTTGERQKVGSVLRALDEDSMVMVDPNRQEVVFQSETLENNNMAQKSPQPASPSLGGPPFAKGENSGMSFSSPHKFPSEIKNPDSGLPMGKQNFRPSNNVVDLKND